MQVESVPVIGVLVAMWCVVCGNDSKWHATSFSYCCKLLYIYL